MSEPPLKRARTESPAPKDEGNELDLLKARIEVLEASNKELESDLYASERKTLVLSLTLHSYANVGAIRYVYKLFIQVHRRDYPEDDDYENVKVGCQRCRGQLRSNMGHSGIQYVEKLYFASDDLIGITSLRAFLKSSVISTQLEKLKAYVTPGPRPDVDVLFRDEELIPKNPEPGRFNNDTVVYLSTPYNIIAKVRLVVELEQMMTKTSWKKTSMCM